MVTDRCCHGTRDREFVFTFNPDPEGPIFPDSISRHLTALCDKYGLEHITPHIIRRTLPTILITKYKVDPKTLQCILGHSNISTTFGYYTVVSDEQRRRDVRRRVEEALRQRRMHGQPEVLVRIGRCRDLRKEHVIKRVYRTPALFPFSSDFSSIMPPTLLNSRYV